MTREEMKKLLPVLQAFAEGKEIEGIYKGLKSPWFNVTDMVLDGGTNYRIKPSPTYRPFKDVEECWQEMKKHNPFGWVKLIDENEYSIMTDVTDSIRFSEAMKEYTFADGSIFGIKEE